MPQVEVRGVRLHYVEAGAGPAVVLLHGLGASHQDWGHQIAMLSRECRVVAPDLRGFGDSSRPRSGYTIPDFAADARALMDKLGIRSAAVVGHSMGGAVALQLALDAPRRVLRLVVVNSMPGFVPRGLRDRVPVWMRMATMATLGPRVLAGIVSRQQFPRADQEALRRTFVTRSARNSRRVYLASLWGMTGWSVEARLGELRVPTLIIASGQDYFSLELAEAFAARIDGARLIKFPEARHGLPLESPEALNSALSRFLLPQPSGAAASPAGGW